MNNLEEWFTQYVDIPRGTNVEDYIKNVSELFLYDIDENFIFPDDLIQLENIKLISIESDDYKIPTTELKKLMDFPNLNEIDLSYISSIDDIPKEFFNMNEVDIVIPFKLNDLEKLPLIIGDSVIHLDIEDKQDSRITYTTKKEKGINFPCWRHEGDGMYFAIGHTTKEEFITNINYEGDLNESDFCWIHEGEGDYLFERPTYGNEEYYLRYKDSSPKVPTYDLLYSFVDTMPDD